MYIVKHIILNVLFQVSTRVRDRADENDARHGTISLRDDVHDQIIDDANPRGLFRDAGNDCDHDEVNGHREDDGTKLFAVEHGLYWCKARFIFYKVIHLAIGSSPARTRSLGGSMKPPELTGPRVAYFRTVVADRVGAMHRSLRAARYLSRAVLSLYNACAYLALILASSYCDFDSLKHNFHASSPAVVSMLTNT